MAAKGIQHVFRLVIVLLFSVCTVSVATAQTNKADNDHETLQALLREVSMLRQALQTLQRMSVDTYRSQLLVDRIRINREDVRRLTASLNEARETLSKTQQTIPSFTEQQKMFEERLQLEVNPTTRLQLEYELKRTKTSLEMYKSQIEPLKEREQRLANELRTEQTKLEELETRLDLLERAIDNDRQKLEGDKPAPVKTP